MSVSKVQLLIFVLFCFFLESQGLEILELEKKHLILVTKSTVRNITDELFRKLHYNSAKLDAKLIQILIVHNYHEDDETLNEVVRLSRTDKSIIKKETENLMALLNEILNEGLKAPEHESAGFNDKEAIHNIDKYLVSLYETKEKFTNSNSSLNDSYDNLDIKNELNDILTSNYANTYNASHSDINPAKESEKTNFSDGEHWVPKSRRIYQGEKTYIKYFPFMASVHILNSFQCGGSIIKSDLVITAATCLQLAWNNRSYSENPTFLSVRVGSNFYNSGGKRIPVLEVYFHPLYNPKNLRNNIALLRLKGHLLFKNNKKLKMIEIDRSASLLPSDVDSVTVVGWGARYASKIKLNTWSYQVNHAVLDVYNFEDCEEVYSSEYVTVKNFCAGFTSKGSGACNHDVGGPGIVSGILAGVMSFGSPVCGTPDAPTVFEKVGFHADWIENIMKLDVSVIEKQAYLQFSPVENAIPASNLITSTLKIPHVQHASVETASQLTNNQVKNLRTGNGNLYNILKARGPNKEYIFSTGILADHGGKGLHSYNEKQKMQVQRLKHFPIKNRISEKKSMRPMVEGLKTDTSNVVDYLFRKTTAIAEIYHSQNEIKRNKYTATEKNLTLRDEDNELESKIVRLINDMNATEYTNESQGYGKKNNEQDIKEVNQLSKLKKEKEAFKIDDDVMTLLYISDDERNSLTFDEINEIFKDLDNMGNLRDGEILSSPDRFNDMTFRSDMKSSLMDLIAESKLKDFLSEDDEN